MPGWRGPTKQARRGIGIMLDPQLKVFSQGLSSGGLFKASKSASLRNSP